MNGRMVEWRRGQASLRLETPEAVLTVWRAHRYYRWSTYDRVAGRFTRHGEELTQDAACKAAMRSGKV